MKLLFTVFSRERATDYQIKLKVPRPKEKCTFQFIIHLYRLLQTLESSLDYLLAENSTKQYQIQKHLLWLKCTNTWSHKEPKIVEVFRKHNYTYYLLLHTVKGFCQFSHFYVRIHHMHKKNTNEQVARAAVLRTRVS